MGMVTSPSGKPHPEQDQTKSVASLVTEAGPVDLLGRSQEVFGNRHPRLMTAAVVEDRTESGLQPNSASPFRDRTTVGLNPAYNPWLAMLCSDHGLPLLHGPQLRDQAGSWRSFFASRLGHEPQALIVEIGCHTGKTLSEMAIAYPRAAFIGIDLTFKRVVMTAYALQKHGLVNAISVLLDARHLDFLVGEDRLDGIVCFFPDPWPKRKQRKKRLFSLNFCSMVSSIVADESFVWVKTDDEGYFTKIIGCLQDSGFNAKKKMTQNFQSIFERRFVLRNVRIYDIVLIKKINNSSGVV